MGTTGYTSPIAIHPGETVRETLDVLGVSQSELSLRTGLAEKTISEILNGKNPITPETALKFERALGISKMGLINMQAQYDADLLRIKESKRLEDETTYLEKFTCYLELAKYKYVKKTRNRVEKVEELLRFFEVDSLTSVKQVLPVAFRKLDTKKVNKESLAAWLKIGRLEASKINPEDFDLEKLREKLEDMRKLTTQDAKEYSQKLVDLCAECGIALVYTPYLKKTYVNGATRWITPKRALIQLSLRHAYADIFWFTFFHEIGHLIKHSKKYTFINFENEQDSELEKEADQFAKKMLIPSSAQFSKFMEGLTKNNLASRIKEFADKNGVAPGIVAGRIGKETGKWNLVAPYRKRLCLK